MFLNKANEVLSPGYLPFETGYRRLDAVQMEIACLHRMHGVNGNMIDWWMRQMGKYDDWLARQHPDDTRLQEWKSRPAENEYVGAKYIVEVDQRKWLISYHDAGEMLDTSRFAEANVTFAVCGRIGAREAPYWAGKFLQVCRDTDFGCELRHRYWFGDTGRKHEAPDPDTMALVTNTRFAEGMIAWDLDGMEHLEAFLPALFSGVGPR